MTERTSHCCMLIGQDCNGAPGVKMQLAVPGHYLLGTDQTCNFQLPTAGRVAAHHASLTLDVSQYRLKDLGSPAGTFVNGVSVDSTVLNDSDELRLGDLTLMFRRMPDPEHAQTVPGGPSESCSEWPTGSSQTGDQQPDTPPTIPGYEILEKIGTGAMGQVYRAVQLGSNRIVAIKCLLTELELDPRARNLFIREACITTSLQHPRIVSSIGFGFAGNSPYLAMEYVPCESLEPLVLAHAPGRRVRLAVKVIRQALEALEFAHERGIVHRDLKPSNLLATRRNNRLHIKMSDFGLGKVYRTAGFSGITGTGEVCGTLTYMSPEQLLDSRFATPACDVYSAVVCLYRLLTGHSPFPDGTYSEVIHARLTGSAASIQQYNPDVPDELACVIHLGLSRDAGMRYTTTSALRHALDSVRLH